MNSDKIKLTLVWLGSPVNEKVKASIHNWACQPNLEIETVTESVFPKNFNERLLQEDAPWAQVADVVRITGFEQSAGWYSDIDSLPGLRDLPRPSKTVFFRTDSRILGNGFFYFDGNKDFYHLWISEISEGLKNLKFDVSQATGPGALTRAVYLYSFDFGRESSRNHIALGHWREFKHWPSQLAPTDRQLRTLCFLSGKLNTHIADASWTKVEKAKRRGARKLAGQVIWLARNSRFEYLAEFLRLLFQRRVEPQDLLKSLFWRSLAVEQIQEKDASPGYLDHMLIYRAENLDEARHLVSTLDVVFISTNASDVREKLIFAGWIPLPPKRSGPAVLSRPKLRKIMSDFKS